jgi:hypothetical protein
MITAGFEPISENFIVGGQVRLLIVISSQRIVVNKTFLCVDLAADVPHT